jgi:hypothetical protein
VAAEFELRAVMQRLDEEFEEDVPERAVEETLVIDAEEGTLADLPSGPGRARRRRGGAGRAATGTRW